MARQGFPSDKQDQFVIRLPDGMRDRIKAAAESNNRSMNAEIVATLEEKYPAPPEHEDVAAVIQLLRDMIAECQTSDDRSGLEAVLDLMANIPQDVASIMAPLVMSNLISSRGKTPGSTPSA